MKIHFKSKVEIEVPNEVVNAIVVALRKGGKEWQSFTDANGETFLIINMAEIEFIA